MAETVADKSSAVQAMTADWDLTNSLMGGTREMRKAGMAYLPKWPEEEPEAYHARLHSSTLFPGLKRTVITLAGKPFSKPLTYGDDVPARIKEWCENDCDRQGRDLHAFGADMMQEALGPGFGGILVDYPDGPPALNQAEEKDRGLRPYFIHIHPHQILGWREVMQGGAPVLSMLRIMESVTEDDGAFSTVDIPQVRVLEPGRWRTYRKAKGDNGQEDWVLHKEGVIAGPKTIPFVPVYGERLGFMCSKPPLLELAHLNVEHWQSASDQRVIMHVARVPILVALGVQDKDFRVTIGASNCVKLPDAGTDLKYVEHSGAAIAAGVVDLDKLEERMRQAGAELLIPNPQRVTAFQVATENAVGASMLQNIALSLEDALDLALQYMADFCGEKTGGHVTLFNDYASFNLSEASVADLLKAEGAGVISAETCFEELQRRGLIDPDKEWDDERERLDSQGPDLGLLGGGAVDPVTGLPVPPEPGPGSPNAPPPRVPPANRLPGA